MRNKCWKYTVVVGEKKPMTILTCNDFALVCILNFSKLVTNALPIEKENTCAPTNLLSFIDVEKIYFFKQRNWRFYGVFRKVETSKQDFKQCFYKKKLEVLAI